MTDKTITFVFPSADDKTRTITWPCKISVPLDGGKIEVQQLDAAFTIPDPDELSAVGPLSNIAAVKKLLVTHLQGFPNNATADFKATKESLLKKPFVVDGLFEGLVDMARGRLAKN